jgi:multiple sugar transport system ATP-binding protein
MASLALQGLTLIYPNGTRALDGVDLEVADGEFLTVLGPSGSGKSSLLRLIAGLAEPTAGSILMAGRDVTAVEPKDRDVAMVFQGLALYPHMTVWENMAFGLLARRTPREEMDRRVREAAETLGLAAFLERKPRVLSGGERQRVALGRALVRRPQIYLFDEPLSSLDARLRQELRAEMARLHGITRTTSIYVTHDQREALSLGDRVAVFEKGRLRQAGTPEEIYRAPCDLFVARFVGEPPINLIEGEVVAGPGGAAFRAQGLRLSLDAPAARPGAATLGLRPEAVAVGQGAGGRANAAAEADGEARATIERVEHLGGDTLLHLRGAWGALVVRAPHDGAAAPSPGETISIRPDPARALLFDPATGARIA